MHVTAMSAARVAVWAALITGSWGAGAAVADELGEAGQVAPVATLPDAATPTGEHADAHVRGADAVARTPRATTWDASGQLDLGAQTQPQFAVDASGTPHPQGPTADVRLIAAVRAQPNATLKLDLELETHTALLAGSPLTLGQAYTARPFPEDRASAGDLARVLPRKAAVTWTTGVGQWSLGFQTFTWGTGVLANDGAGTQQADGPQFGASRLGNIVLRAGWAARPFATASSPFWRTLAVFVAADAIVRDDNASWLDGDSAFAGVLGFRAQDDHHVLGLLLSGRSQRDRADPYRPGDASETRVVVVDAHGRTSQSIGTNQRLTAEGEVALILGSTTRPFNDATFRDGARVQQLGALARLRWDHDVHHLSAHLEAGYASGDNDPRDASARQFSMHTDHNVGLLLFERVLPAVSARSVDRLADGQLVASTPPSARFAINPGAVQNAVYLHPVVRWRPVSQLDLRLGWLLAAAAADVTDPYQSAVHGGFATTPGGAVRGGGIYGQEVDARVSWTQPLPGAIALRVGAEGGVFVPGSVFAGMPGLGTPWLARGFLGLGW